MKHVVVQAFAIYDGCLYIFVRPSWRAPRCSRCGRKCPGYDTRPDRNWRHLDWGGATVMLRYAPQRVDCPKCGVHVEKVPWCADTESRFTTRFEEAVCFMAQRTDKTSVKDFFGIAWPTVGSIIERVVERRRPEAPLENLTRIGVDELSHRKGHRYLTLVSDHDTNRIVWAMEGKGAETLNTFFEELGEAGCARIEVISMDMSQAYISSASQHIPQAQIVFDRFHVQALVSEALDETRREEWRRLRAQEPEAAKDVKGLRWALLKNPWNLTPKQGVRLSTLQRDNRRLYRAYLLKEEFAAILDRRQPNVVKGMLIDWMGWASRSRLPAFVKVARTIRKHLDDIVAYVRWRVTNSTAEGLNTKARLLTRRAYGFHTPSAVIAMIMLCCSGLVFKPPRVRLNSPT